jgi:crooked neck
MQRSADQVLLALNLCTSTANSASHALLHLLLLLLLRKTQGDAATVREVYERAIACVPPVAQKRFWRRYIYLWINYALFEELSAGDTERARAVLKAALQVIPHASFTFAKVWLMLAHLEVRRRDLPAARKVLGEALGRCPKERLFKGYIALELQLGEIDRYTCCCCLSTT